MACSQFAGAHVAPVSVAAQTALLKDVVAAMPTVRTAKVAHVNETTDGTQANVTMAVAMTGGTANSSAEVSSAHVHDETFLP